MPVTTNAPAEPAVQSLPAVPLTLEGSSMLHQMLRVRWTAWKALASSSAVGNRSGSLRRARRDGARTPAARARRFRCWGTRAI